MKKLNIRLQKEGGSYVQLIPVNAVKELIINGWTQPIKLFTHPRIDHVTLLPRTDRYRPWTATEYQTGISILQSGDNSKTILQDVVALVERIGETRYHKTVNDHIKKYGIINP